MTLLLKQRWKMLGGGEGMRQRIYDRLEKWWDSLPPERQQVHMYWAPQIAVLATGSLVLTIWVVVCAWLGWLP